MNRLFGRFFGERGVILAYHRIAEVRPDPWGLAVSPAHFREQLEVLAKYWHPLRLQEVVRALKTGQRLPPRAVVLTFDDGYADYVSNARPLLQQYGIPATLFVTCGKLDQETAFWWDELAHLLLEPANLPETLTLWVAGTACHWELGAAATYGDDERRRDRDRRAWEGKDGSRYAFHFSVWERLRPLPDAERELLLDEIRSWTGRKCSAPSGTRPLSSEELSNLTRCELTEVGSHTLTHPLLPTLPVAAQRTEIAGSKRNLEEILEVEVESFAYPYGKYNNETEFLVREAGFRCACTTETMKVGKDANPFTLPRIVILDSDGDQFLRRLHR